jgi:hypothetical protein
MWHVDPLLDNDRDIKKLLSNSLPNKHVLKATIEVQQLGMALSLRSEPRCYKRYELGAAVSKSVELS